MSMNIGAITATLELEDKFTRNIERAQASAISATGQFKRLFDSLKQNARGNLFDAQFGKYGAAAKQYAESISTISAAAKKGGVGVKEIGQAMQLAKIQFQGAKKVIDDANSSVKIIGNTFDNSRNTIKNFGDNVRTANGALSKGADGGYTYIKMLERLAVRIAAVAVVYKGLGAIKDSFVEAVDISGAMARIQTVTNAGKKGADELNASFRALGAQTGKGPKELADAYYLIASNTQDASKNIDILTTAAKASATGLGDTADVAKALTGIVNAYGSSNMTAAHAADVLFETVKQGGAEAKDIAPVLGRVAAIASEMGVSFEQAGAYIASFTRLGVGADEAVTSLRSLLNTLLKTKPDSGAEKQLEALGMTIHGLRQEIKEKGLTEAMLHLMQAAHGDEEAISKIIPNVRALAGVLANYRSQAENVVKIQDAINNSTGVMDKGFEVASRTGEMAAKKIAAEWENFKLELGNSIMPMLLQVGKGLSDALTPDTARQLGRVIGDALTFLKPVVVLLEVAAKNIGLVEGALTALFAHHLWDKWGEEATRALLMTWKQLTTTTVATTAATTEAEALAAAETEAGAAAVAASGGFKIMGMSLSTFGGVVTIIVGAAVALRAALKNVVDNWQTEIEGMVTESNKAGAAFQQMWALAHGQGAVTTTQFAQIKKDAADATDEVIKLSRARDEMAEKNKANGGAYSNEEREAQNAVRTAMARRDMLNKTISVINEQNLVLRDSTATIKDNTETAIKPGAEAQQRFAEKVAETTAQLKANAEAARAAFTAAQAKANVKLGGGSPAEAEEEARQAEITRKLQERINAAQSHGKQLTAETVAEWRKLVEQEVIFNAGAKGAEEFSKDLKSMAEDAEKAFNKLRGTFDGIAKSNRDALVAQSQVNIEIMHGRAHLEAQQADIAKIAKGGERAAAQAAIEAHWREMGLHFTQEQVDEEADLQIGMVRLDKLMQIALENSRSAWDIWTNAAFSAIDAVGNAIGDAITQGLTKGKIDGDAIWKSFADSMIKIFVDAVIEMVKETLARWLAMELSKTAITASQAAIRKGIDAASGASGGSGGTGGVGVGQVAGLGGKFGTSGNLFYTGGGSSGITAVGWAGIYAAIVMAFLNYVKTRGTPKVTGSVTYGPQAGQEGAFGLQSGLSEGSHGMLRRLSGMDKAMQELVKRVNEFVINLGGIIAPTTEQAQLLVRKIGQGKKTDWVVVANGVAEHFGKEMDAAMDYAMVQALKMVNTAGLSPEVATALKNTTARTMDELNAQLQVAHDAVVGRLGDIGAQLLDIYNKYKAEIEKAQELGISTDGLIKARDREMNALRNQILGIDTSTSDALAALLSFQNGMNEIARNAASIANTPAAGNPNGGGDGRGSFGHPDTGESGGHGYGSGSWGGGGGHSYGPTNTAPGGLPAAFDFSSVQAVTDIINKMMADLARAGITGDAAKKHVEQVLQGYFASLSNAPRKLTDKEVNMAIFDQLYKYLEGSKKYAKQAHEYARLKVEMEFATIKAQLIALGKWEEFASMFDDAYHAALAAIDKGDKGGKGGSGVSKPDASGIADIIDQLLGYLKNTKDFEALREKYAKLRVIAEFQTMKLQLMAAGVWKDVEALWNAAYNAALAAAGKPPAHEGGGGGGGKQPMTRQERAQFIKDTRYRLDQAEETNPLQRQINDINRSYQDALKGLKEGSKEWNRINDLRREEIQLATQQAQDAAQNTYDQLVGNTNAFTDLHKKFSDATKQIRDAGFSADQTAEMIARLQEAEGAAVQALSDQMLGDLFGQLASMLDDSTQKTALLQAQAALRWVTELANAKNTFTLLKAQGTLTDAQIKMVQDAITTIENAGPPTVGDGGNMPDTPGAYSGEIRNGWIWNGQRWVKYTQGEGDNPVGGSGSNDAQDAMKKAMELLQKYKDEGLNSWQKALKDLNDDFKTIRDTLGNTADVIDTYNAAMERLRKQFLQGLQEFYDAITKGTQGGQSIAQQYTNAAAKYNQLLAAVRGGDLSQADALRDAAQAYRDLAAQMFGTSTGGFASVIDQITRDIGQILGVTDVAGNNVVGGPSYFVQGTQQTVSAIAAGSDATVTAITDLSTRLQRIEDALTVNVVNAVKNVEYAVEDLDSAPIVTVG